MEHPLVSSGYTLASPWFTEMYFGTYGMLACSALDEDARTLKAYEARTVRNLLVYVPENDAAGWFNTGVITSRINYVDGNLTVSIPPGATGEFEDTIHSDSLIIGDLFNYIIRYPGIGGGPVYFSILRQLITGTPIIGAKAMGNGAYCGIWFTILGELGYDSALRNEVSVQYKMSIPAILENGRAYCEWNTGTGATVHSMINGSSGNIAIVIGAGLTGWFEDTIHSDSLVAGDLIEGYLSGNSVFVENVQFAINTTHKPLVGSGLTSISQFHASSTVFTAIEGQLYLDPTEANWRVLAGEDRILTNLYAFVRATNLDTNVTVKTRINGADGNLSVTLLQGVAGDFEDTIHSDTVVPTDYINYVGYVVGGTGGACACTYLGVCESVIIVLPTVETDPATDIAAISATLNGLLDNDGGENCDCGFEWGLTNAYGHTTGTLSKATGEAFAQGIGGLSPGTTYHFRAFATNSAGTSYGADTTFITSGAPPVAAPTVHTEGANTISQTGATLNGGLDDDGGMACNCGFQYGLTIGYGSTTPTQSKTTGQLFSQAITGLSPGTLYHFRALATNTAGTSYGADKFFVTDSPALTAVCILTLELASILEEA